MASYQYIYVMKGLNKTFPGGKQILKDIWLSFLPGAKIGVLGLNGAGKSTLLKVMAGQDDNFTGEAWAAEGVKVGFLQQEPHLNDKKDVLGNVMEGAGDMATMLARFEEVSNAFSDPDADMDKLIAEQAELQEKNQRPALEEKTADARRRTMQRELEWMGTSPSARRSKSKARITAYNQMVEEEQKATLDTQQIVIPAGPRLGDHVIEADKISKGFGDRLLIDNLSFKLPPGGIVGVIGPNGAGKTTLFKLITGQDKPDSGSFSVGPTVKLGYVDQSRETLDANKTVWEELSGGLDLIKLGNREVNSRAYCGSFNFKGADQQKKVGQLSGGERNRVNLAKMLKSGANVLLLDEPTNDLDVDTLRALEEALVEFAGCAVIISHDRWFLDRIATHILSFEGDSHVEWFEGNFHDYEKDKMRRLGQDSIIPHRVKYKKLTR